MNVMSRDGLAEMECSNYTYHIAPPPPLPLPGLPPAASQTPLKTFDQHCYIHPKGRGDIDPGTVEYWADWACNSWASSSLQPGQIGAIGLPPAMLTWGPQFAEWRHL
jgi:hypothetical protein